MRLPGVMSFLALLVAVAALSAPANAALESGKEYTLVNPPLATETGKNIEVVEYFWYGCPHCYDLESTMVSYARTLPKDVTFRRVPGILRDSWAPNAKAYYTLEVLGLLGKLHQEVFDAIHRDKVNLDDENTLFDWVAKRGVDRKKFAEAYNSFAVQSKVLKAKQISRMSGISGVPAVIVDGKYLITVGMAGTPGKFLKALDELVSMARRDRAAGK